jgi:hypothetical protein
MRRKRLTEEQIIQILKQADAGAKPDELCRRHIQLVVLQLLRLRLHPRLQDVSKTGTRTRLFEEPDGGLDGGVTAYVRSPLIAELGSPPS